MATIKSIHAREVLDSRGNPTVESEITTEDGIYSAMVPSGASTGSHEAHELRDNDNRYSGKGVARAVANVNDKIAGLLVGKSLENPSDLDREMISLDNTKNKEHLGANAILSVSMAVFRAAAGRQQLYQYLARHFQTKPSMPMPFANVINGGRHAGGELYMQEFMLTPAADSFAEAARMIAETYHILKSVIKNKYGSSAVNVGDEGGFAPPLKNPQEALDLMTEAVKQAGYQERIMFAMDPAASEFFSHGKYHDMTADELTALYTELKSKYPIISIEDPFAEDDFSAWNKFFTNANMQVVGDDLLVTNEERIRIAAEKQLCNALLLKVNQIGTVTEAVNAAKLAYSKGWKVMVSHRSGETEDSFIADLAVALGCGQIKLGAPCRSDRTSKYNRLLRIEETLKKSN